MPHRTEFENVFLNSLVNVRVSNIAGFEPHSKATNIPISLMKLYKLYEGALEFNEEDFFEQKLSSRSVIDVLQDYSYCVMDLSFNEVTIHSISHSHAPLDKPYLRLESKILKQTSIIYQQINPVMQGKEVFEKFFSLDSRIMSQLFLNRTYCRFFNCAIEKQLVLIDEYLLVGHTVPSSSGRNGVEFRPMSLSKSRPGLSFDTFEQLVNSTGDKELDNSSPDACLKLFKESVLKKIMERDISSEDEEIEDKIKKASSCTSRKKNSEHHKFTPGYLKRHHSKIGLPKLECDRKPHPGHNLEEFEIFSELRSLLVCIMIISGRDE